MVVREEDARSIAGPGIRRYHRSAVQSCPENPVRGVPGVDDLHFCDEGSSLLTAAAGTLLDVCAAPLPAPDRDHGLLKEAVEGDHKAAGLQLSAVDGPRSHPAPARQLDLGGDVPLLTPGLALILACLNKDVRVVHGPHEDHRVVDCIIHGNWISVRVTFSAGGQHLNRAPGPSTIPAALHHQIDVPTVRAGLPALCKGKQASTDPQYCRSAEDVVTFLTVSEDQRLLDPSPRRPPREVGVHSPQLVCGVGAFRVGCQSEKLHVRDRVGIHPCSGLRRRQGFLCQVYAPALRRAAARRQGLRRGLGL
mmetsp:Transcript_56839/g.161312  ORF Transcript_56839/g.161312 Transcript_56839/m.161312 type:complete len:307 (-) Transcript_56839:254-1174(-)